MSNRITLEQFITRSKKIHGKNSYIYSKVVLAGVHAKVIITCKIHGDFDQKPINHFNGQGCRLCSIDKRAVSQASNREEFVKKAKIKHGNKFNYDSVIYLNSHTKIQIGCSEHGLFSMLPSNHLKGQGCPTCRGYKKTTKSVIAEFKSVHGDTYDYHNADFIDTKSDLNIICSVHGVFQQTYDNHFRNKQGCPTCAVLKRTLKLTSNNRDFIEKAISIHGDNFIYDNAIYKKAKEKVDIFCSTCSKVFAMTPNNHLRGQGCPYCDGHHRTTQELIEEFQSVHDDTYEYDNVILVRMDKSISITCKIHGNFYRTPRSHLYHKRGCPNCASKGFDANKPASFYLLPIQKVMSSILGPTDFAGYGISNVLKNRLRKHKNNLHEKFYRFRFGYYVSFENGKDALDLENFIKQHFPKKHVNTEIPGFKTEAIKGEYTQDFIRFVRRYLKHKGLNKLKFFTLIDDI